MSTVAEQESAAAADERGDSGGSWVALIAVGLLMTLLVAASGFLFEPSISLNALLTH
ncbi:hypothetical protein [Microbacterium lacticum]